MNYPKRPDSSPRLANRNPWIPDWRDRSAYEWLEKRNSTKQFAWEFLRRNQRYIALLSRIHVDPSRERPEAQTRQPQESKTDYINRLMRPGYDATSGHVALLMQEFCLHTETFQSPSVNDPPKFIPRFGQKVALGEKERAVEYRIDVQPYEAFIGFDLRYPFEWHLDGLREQFEAARDRGLSGGLFNKSSPRLRPERYIDYLRILDAEFHARPTVKSIADTLSYDRPDGAVLDEKTVRRYRDAARDLRDRGFADLATRPED